jgi:hypothetical protein
VAMTRCTCRLRNFLQLACTLLTFLADGVRFLGLCFRPSPALAAENLFLRKQLALYQERQVKPRRTTHVLRMVPGLARSQVRQAASVSRGATRNLYPLAWSGVPAVLAMEIPSRTPTHSC